MRNVYLIEMWRTKLKNTCDQNSCTMKLSIMNHEKYFVKVTTVTIWNQPASFRVVEYIVLK